jgi:hypothetical protein
MPIADPTLPRFGTDFMTRLLLQTLEEEFQ